MKTIATAEAFHALLAKSAKSGTTVFVDFTATWCGPCQQIAPTFKKLSKLYPTATFVKVDVDENEDVATECRVSAMPTFKAFQGKAEVAELCGADKKALRSMVEQLTASAASAGEPRTAKRKAEAMDDATAAALAEALAEEQAEEETGDVDRTKEARKAEKKAKKEKTKAAKQTVSATEAVDAPAASSAPASGAVEAGFLTFEETPFAPPIKALLKSAGFAAPTPIQTHGWPAALTGRDLIAVAKTGSGKTLAFVLPLLHRLSATTSSAAWPRAVVLSPTRELASQIHVDAEKYGKLVGHSSCVVYGGTPVREQKAELKQKRPALIVATPGRLTDLLEQQVLDLGACEAAVLDEADRLLDMGFEPQVRTPEHALRSLLPSPSTATDCHRLPPTATDCHRLPPAAAQEDVWRAARVAANAALHGNVAQGRPQACGQVPQGGRADQAALPRRRRRRGRRCGG